MVLKCEDIFLPGKSHGQRSLAGYSPWGRKTRTHGLNLETTTTINKASGSDGIPAEIFQILKDDAVKSISLICQQIWEKKKKVSYC